MSTPPLLMLAEGHKPRPRRAPVIRPLESKLQCDIAKLLDDYGRQDWRFTHFPAGEKRDAVTGARLKRYGLKPGWPDFLLLDPDGRLHCLELKREGETLSDPQENFWRFCVRAGVPHSVCRTIDEVLETLSRWQCLRIKVARRDHA